MAAESSLKQPMWRRDQLGYWYRGWVSGTDTPYYGQTQAQAFDVKGNAMPAGAAADAALAELNNPYQYTGRENDGDGLYYYRARYYSPQMGRFTQEDPLGFVDGPNPYAYVGGDPLQYSDPLGLWAWGDPLPQGLIDSGAGFGDVVLLGQGGRLRGLLGLDGGVNVCSSAYGYGEWAGIAASLFTGGYGGLRAAGVKGAGKEFSHWIPNRMGGPRSIWNGNYVTAVKHALSDPYRYRFMKRAWKEFNPLPSVFSQQWNRIPYIYKGLVLGAGFGAAGAAISGCECAQ